MKRSRRLLGAVLALCALAGCSLGLQQVPKGWDGTTEPECDDGWGPVIGDALIGGVGLGVGWAASGSKDKNADVFAIGGFAIGLVFGIAGAIGEERVRDCKTAQTAWRVGGSIGHGAADATMRTQRAIEVRQAPEPEAPITPRGWFCATSEGGGICARERRACERERSSVAAAVMDFTPCTLVETAWCFAVVGGRDARCFPSEEDCGNAIARAGGDAAGECEERR